MAHVKVGSETLEGEGRIDSILQSNGFYPDSFLYIMDGRPVPSDTEISDSQAVEAIKVASGG